MLQWISQYTVLSVLWLIILLTCLQGDQKVSTETQYQYNYKQCVSGQSFYHNKFLASRVQLYSNSTVTFQIELLLCGDRESNPGPANDDNSIFIPS